MPIPPQGYVAMGCVLKFGGKDPTPPSGEAVDGLVCVHKSAASIGQAAQKAVWSDAGTFGGKSCSIWPIVPRDNEGLAVESFTSVSKIKLSIQILAIQLLTFFVYLQQWSVPQRN